MPTFQATGFIIKRNRTQVPFNGAAAMSRVDRWEHPGEWYRDDISAAKIGSPFVIPTEKGATTAKNVGATSIVSIGLTSGLNVPQDVLENAVVARGYALPIAQDDALMHVPPRPVKVRRTYVTFWDAASPQPGEAAIRTGTTTNGSVEVTAINIEGLFVGQGVTGTGIPVGAKISEIIDEPATGTRDVYPPVVTAAVRKITLTLAATGSATVALTFAAGTGNVVAECPADEYEGFSSDKAILLR